MAFNTAAVAMTATAAVIFDPATHGNKGNFLEPQLILIQNRDSNNSVAVGGSDVAYGTSPIIAPGGNFECRIEAGEPIYGVCDTAKTASVVYIITRA